MVEKSVSRVAQDFILDSGITLILNTKPVNTFTVAYESFKSNST